MKRLPFSVLCKQSTYWERIAAFDCESPTRAYAEACAKTNPQFEYLLRHNQRNIAEWNNRDQE